MSSKVPKLDKEWFGTEKDKKKAEDAALDAYCDELRAEGENPDREFERELLDEYTVSYRTPDTASIYFVDSSYDIDKARDIYSIMNNDLSPDIALIVYDDF